MRRPRKETVMPELPRVPLGRWVADLIELMRDNLAWLFNGIRALFGGLLDTVEWLFALPHPLLFIALAAALVLWLRGWQFTTFTVAAFALIWSMGYWPQTIETLSLIVVATVIAVIIAVPVGVAAARNRTVSTLVRPVLDFMQTLPVFVYLLPAVFFFRIGTVPGLIATLVFAIPPGVRLTELGIRQVDKEVVEAAEAFGATKNQILLRVQMPLAMPSIMQGVNQVIMLALSMVVVAGMIGAQGLGADVVRSITRLEIGLGFESGLAVVILAIFLDRVTSAFRDRAMTVES
jgi:glycine betaine/proline transport system permease protein